MLEFQKNALTELFVEPLVENGVFEQKLVEDILYNKWLNAGLCKNVYRVDQIIGRKRLFIRQES